MNAALLAAIVFTCFALGYRYCMIWGLIAAVIMWLGAPWFVSLISDDAGVQQAAVAYLFIVPISIGFMGMVNVANASFNALSKPAPPLMLSFSRLVVVYIPAAIAAGHYAGYVGVYLIMALVTVLFGVLGRRWNTATIQRLTPRA